MNPSCPSMAIDPDRTPIHFRFGTFLTVVGAIVSIAIAVGASYSMLQAHQRKLDEITPFINKIQVLEASQIETNKRLDRIDQNVQLVLDTLIKKK